MDEDEGNELLDDAERRPVVSGIIYLLVVIAGICGVVFWLVARSTG